MSISLNRLSQEFSVSIDSIVSFLQENGVSIDSASYSYTLIDDEQYQLIVDGLPRKRMRILPWLGGEFNDDPSHNRGLFISYGWQKYKADIFAHAWKTDQYIWFSKGLNSPSLKYWSSNDIKTKCPSALDIEGRMCVDELCEPTGYIPIEVKTSSQESHNSNSDENDKNGMFSPHKTEYPQAHVVGKIDLSALNQQTRPRRKTKEEKREERIAKGLKKKEKQQSAQIAKSVDMETIRDIWQNLVDIQERIIKQRCNPFTIDPESIEVDGNKVRVKIDESQKAKQLDELMRDELGVEDYTPGMDFILVDEEKWQKLQPNQLSKLSIELAKHYIELDTTPTINVTVDYGKDMGGFDKMSLVELRRLDSLLKSASLIEGSIDDTVACIAKVNVNTDEYMRYLFGDHLKMYERKKKKKDKPQIITSLEYKDSYIPWEEYKKFNKSIGLECKYYKIIIKVNDRSASKELSESFDCYFPNTDTFEFLRSYKEDHIREDFLLELNNNITAFINQASFYCPIEDISCGVLFVYTAPRLRIRKAKYSELENYLKEFDHYSFNPETREIGLDFNWREQDISSLIEQIQQDVPFVEITTFDDHKMKCKVQTQMIGYEQLKSFLENKYEDIVISNDSSNHQIKIKLPFENTELYEQICTRLNTDLAQLNVTGFNISFEPYIKGKVRINVKYNHESRMEDIEDSLKEMRRSDFGFMVGETTIQFGKLLKANYPYLVFDIDVEDNEREKIVAAFEQKAVTTIIPMLTGDLEKISRLKNTFTMATTGAELVNPHLQQFIFDAAEANETKDIDYLLMHDGPVYKDLCDNLLNQSINESQKQAIIKAMLADDLAVIQGPPGTGKSTAIAELIWQLVRKGLQQSNRPEFILLTSETNLAVDNAISRILNPYTNLVKPVRFGDEEKLESEGQQFSIELMKRWVQEGDACLYEIDEETDTVIEDNLVLKNWLSNISNRSFMGSQSNDNPVITRWRNYLEHPDESLRKLVYERYIKHANVIGATCSSIGEKRSSIGYTSFFKNYCEVKGVSGKHKRNESIRFTTVIQDESSKSTPAELVLPFVYGERAIVIGDHRQLPPVLDQEEFENIFDFAIKTTSSDSERNRLIALQSYIENHFDEMEVSHFQRLFERIHPSLKGSFNLQYRMHPDINQVIEQFYRDDGGLYCGLVNPEDRGVDDPDFSNPASRYHGIEIPGLIDHNTHVLFVDTSSPEMLDGTSRVNYGEVEVINKLLNLFEDNESYSAYLSHFSRDEDKQIGVISFYGKQIKQLRRVANNHKKIPIRVSTVDRFQGMERNIVIVSMVRSNTIQSMIGQRPDYRRYPKLGYPKQQSLGFAQSPNRLNVALSRARRLLIIVGNRDLFSTRDIYRRLFDTIDANSNNVVVSQNEILS